MLLHDVVNLAASEGPGSDTFLAALVTTTGAVMVTLIPLLIRRRAKDDSSPTPPNPPAGTNTGPSGGGTALSPFEQDLRDQRDIARGAAARLGRWVAHYREMLIHAGVDPGPDVSDERDPP